MNKKIDKARVVIAIPLATPWIYWRTVAAILEMEKPFESDLMVFQGALVDRARNRLMEQVLSHPLDPTHLLFLDADVVPPSDTLVRLLKHDLPIVSGLYRKRVPPHEPMAFTRNFRPIPIKGPKLREVDVVGAGCLLLQRHVLDRIPPPWFTSEWSVQGHLSEDFSFCKKARGKGFKIYVDTSIRPLHLEPVGIGTKKDGSVDFIPLD